MTQAGWYTDPGDGAQVRWWDGQQWTTHTQPALPSAAVPVSRAGVAYAASTPVALAPRPPAPTPFSSMSVLPAGSSQWPTKAHRPGWVTALIVIACVVVGLVVLSIVAAIAIPVFLNSRGQSMADRQVPVLAHSAPATLAGLAPTTSRGKPATVVLGWTMGTWSSSQTLNEAPWAWSSAYGTGASTTVVFAEGIPQRRRASIYLLVQKPDGGARFFAQTAAALPYATLRNSVPQRFDVSVPGQLWCAAGSADEADLTYCAWTDGKEDAAVLRQSGDVRATAALAATALAQMAAEEAAVTAPTS